MDSMIAGSEISAERANHILGVARALDMSIKESNFTAEQRGMMVSVIIATLADIYKEDLVLFNLVKRAMLEKEVNTIN